MKKLLIYILAAAIALTVCGCGGRENDKKYDEDVLSVNTFEPTEKNLKFLGRTETVEDCLWLAYSGSGVEFTFNGTSASCTILCDDNFAYEDFNSKPRIAVFIDGERAFEQVLENSEETVSLYNSGEEREVTVRIVKISETGNSTIAIKSITAECYGSIKPTAAKAHSIEFIGDSITCGYCVDAKDQNESFSTRTEDCTKAYAYLTAQLLDCDCSLVSKSGHGIISGYTGDGSKAIWGVMGDYYESFGSGGGSFKGKSPDSVEWDFKSRNYDAVVINLGTNDNSYTGSDPDKREEYKQGYIDFLKRVRKLNPDSKIFCTLGIMGDELFSTIESAMEEYTLETGDDNIIDYHFTPQNGAKNGLGADWHPSAVTHKEAAEGFAAFVNETMGW